MTAGVVLGLFVVWELGYVAVTEGRAQATTVRQLEGRFAGGIPPKADPRTGATGPDGLTTRLSDGQLWAVVRIPRLGGPDWGKPVYQGVGLDVLAEGLGHYPQTQLPGQVGNVAIAGHRAGHGNPLIDIDAIRTGDAMVIETQAGWYVYTAQRHLVVEPDDTTVLAPVPGRPGVTPTAQWFTLTSCEPRYGSATRWIVQASFTRFVPRAAGVPPEVTTDPRGS